LDILGAPMGHLQGLAKVGPTPVQLEAGDGSVHLAPMSTARKLPPRMTVGEFLEWEPDDRSGALWQLRDGEPEMMAPAPIADQCFENAREYARL
jgi:hypothetical protein